ncbi:MAG TPA: GNAT family protein [Acidimicrobiales bacterium]
MPEQLLVAGLVGRCARLEPLMLSHVEDLVDACQVDRSMYGFTPVPEDRASMERYVSDLLSEWQAGLVVPFAQVDQFSERAVGATRFMTLRRRSVEDLPYAVEIGGTWLGSRAQRTGINTEAKFLMLRHAFETWGVARVDLKTDARNERSRTAILRIGATFEGVLRSWQPSLVDGEQRLYRDSAMYSITNVEWPRVREYLKSLIDSRSPGAGTIEAP